ncbi:MAG: MBL fold metallo-hydrolase [Clostridium sp.]|uniref:MBL fold metallo-hydrolase n=1 Tax=Clostridium sp. TaxID=1506 RepID=UPI0025C6BBA6|nr:MBL fold metallo-hydrolase [Clostridium sp.]MCE5221387.1 MBL fold metallo-hydrolase [Clostridium sp.]
MCSVAIKCFPASYGESFLLTISQDKEEYNILIDCGLVDTYKNFIKKELESIKKIDLIVLTHIDDDHIGGAVELFKDKEIMQKIDIGNIWFNDLYKITEGKYKHDIVLESNEKEESNKSIFDEEVSYESAKILANYILKSKHRDVWNKDEVVVQCEKQLYKEVYPINDSIKFVLLSPKSQRINKLFEEWCDELEIESDGLVIDNKTMNKFYNYYINSEDSSEVFDEDCCIGEIQIEELAKLEFNKSNPANNASIAFFIEVGGKKMLFLGDSNSSDIKKSLGKYVEDNELKKIDFDLVKLSHHGSKYNISSKFFDLFSSKKYVISTNGDRYNHPNLECLCKVIVKQTSMKEILFNYRNCEILRELDKIQLKEKYKYIINMPASAESEEILNINI